jgi:hypothetical protein
MEALSRVKYCMHRIAKVVQKVFDEKYIDENKNEHLGAVK